MSTQKKLKYLADRAGTAGLYLLAIVGASSWEEPDRWPDIIIGLLSTLLFLWWAVQRTIHHERDDLVTRLNRRIIRQRERDIAKNQHGPAVRFATPPKDPVTLDPPPDQHAANHQHGHHNGPFYPECPACNPLPSSTKPDSSQGGYGLGHKGP